MHTDLTWGVGGEAEGGGGGGALSLEATSTCTVRSMGSKRASCLHDQEV